MGQITNLLYHSVILIDFDSLHGHEMMQALRFYSSRPCNLIWEKITDISELSQVVEKYKGKKNRVFCIPFACDNMEVCKGLENLGIDNIIVCAKDQDLLYPWSFKNMVVADDDTKEIWITINGTPNLVRGSSLDCAYLAIKERERFC